MRRSGKKIDMPRGCETLLDDRRATDPLVTGVSTQYELLTGEHSVLISQPL
jgi:hypothetical protein